MTLEVEQELARQFRDKDDLESARRMVLAHLRFVVRIARDRGLGFEADRAQATADVINHMSTQPAFRDRYAASTP